MPKNYRLDSLEGLEALVFQIERIAKSEAAKAVRDVLILASVALLVILGLNLAGVAFSYLYSAFIV